MSNVQLAVQFFLQLAVILLFCRLVGAMALRLGQPQVVAEMVAGVLLGPSLFGLVGSLGHLAKNAQKATALAGYSSLEEFVAHCIENELKKLTVDKSEAQVADQLRGLGYIE